MEDGARILRRIGYGAQWLFQQDHKAPRYRSRWWFLLPVLLNLPGALIAFFAIRHDDPDKAKSCLLLGIILFAVSVVQVAASVAILAGLTEVITEEMIAGWEAEFLARDTAP